MPRRSHSRWHLWTVGGVIMALSWLADSALDAGFEGGGLIEQTFHPSPHELSIRVLFLCCQFLLLLYIAHLFRQRDRLDQRLASAQQQVDYERNKAEAVLEGLGDGISLQDPELRVLYQNVAHREMMGDHLGDFCYHAYQNREDVCPHCHLVQAFEDRQVHTREVSATINDEEHHFEIVATPLFDSSGELIAGIESVRNINQRKQDEAELVAMTSNLQQRTAELELANAELEAFSYSLSHDLRSYLTNLTLAAESLSADCTKQPNCDGDVRLEMILDTCEEMDDLISAMLTLGRATRHELQRKKVNLSTIAALVLSSMPACDSQRAITFNIAPDLYANCDEQLLQIALQNLLSNACKYTREEPRAEVSLSLSQQDGEQVFAVADNGCGFDMREADQLFQPFTRLSGAGSTPGFGIGLATVQRVIQRHGGRIWADAEPGKGASFFFTLPETEPQQAATADSLQ